MKKLMTLSAMIFALAITLNAQNDKDKHPPKNEPATREDNRDKNDQKPQWEGNDVSEQARQHFDKDFANTSDSKWERTAKFDEVRFTKGGKNSRAFYGSNTRLVGTSYDKTFEDLPIRAQRTIKRKYRSYTPGDVQFYKENSNNREDMTLYNKQFSSSNNYFVEMTNDNKRIVLRVNMNGDVSFFTQTK